MKSRLIISTFLFILMFLNGCGGGSSSPTKVKINNLPNSSLRLVIPNLIESFETISPEIENLPDNSTVKWSVDGEVTDYIKDLSFEQIGEHQVLAEVYSNGKITNSLYSRVIVTKNKSIASIFVTPALSTYYHDETEKDPLSGFELTIPENASLGNEEVKIEKADISKTNFGISLKPHGLTFEKPIKITMPYSSFYEENDIDIIHYSKTGEKTSIPILSIDKNNHLVTFLTDHFSTYTAEASNFLGFRNDDDLKDVKARIGWSKEDGTDEELVKILDFSLGGNSHVYDYYLLDKQNIEISKSIEEERPYAVYKKLYSAFKLNPAWEDAKSGLESISTIMDMSPDVSSMFSAAVNIISNKNIVEIPLNDITSKKEWAGKVVGYVAGWAQMYDPVSIGNDIMKTLSDTFWNVQLNSYFLDRKSGCNPAFSISPPCAAEYGRDDKQNNGFYSSGYAKGASVDLDTKQKEAFWRNAESMYQRMLVSKGNNHFKELVSKTKYHFESLEEKKHPYVDSISVTDEWKNRYRGVKTEIEVKLHTSGISLDADFVTLSKFNGSTYTEIDSKQNCGVKNSCRFSLTPDEIGLNIKYRITSLFNDKRIGYYHKDLKLDIIDLYRLDDITIDKVVKISKDKYRLYLNTVFRNVEGEEVTFLNSGDYECKALITRYNSKSCDNGYLDITKDELRDAEGYFDVSYSEKSESYDFKDAKHQVDLTSAVKTINSEEAINKTPASIMVTKVNGMSFQENNIIKLNEGDRVEFLVKGVSNIVRADFDGNHRFSNNLSSFIGLDEIEKNSRYIQTFSRKGIFKPAIRYKDSSGRIQEVKIKNLISVLKKDSPVLLSLNSGSKIELEEGSKKVIKFILTDNDKKMSRIVCSANKLGVKISNTNVKLVVDAPSYDFDIEPNFTVTCVARDSHYKKLASYLLFVKVIKKAVVTKIVTMQIEMHHETHFYDWIEGGHLKVEILSTWDRNDIKKSIESSNNMIWDPNVTILRNAVFQARVSVNSQLVKTSSWKNTTSYYEVLDFSDARNVTVVFEIWSKVQVKVLDQ